MCILTQMSFDHTFATQHLFSQSYSKQSEVQV
ncbi:hypothetical protein NTGM5_150091 [Candidatus Nitrotoga sp. M5]|nr:hypothetical protein NTGM5_150091 [Candidatus Nitrotoga sp. M5]